MEQTETDGPDVTEEQLSAVLNAYGVSNVGGLIVAVHERLFNEAKTAKIVAVLTEAAGMFRAGMVETLQEGIYKSAADVAPPGERALLESDCIAYLSRDVFAAVSFGPGVGWGFTDARAAKSFAADLAERARSLYLVCSTDVREDGTPETAIAVDVFTTVFNGQPLPLWREVYTANGKPEQSHWAPDEVTGI